MGRWESIKVYFRRGCAGSCTRSRHHNTHTHTHFVGASALKDGEGFLPACLLMLAREAPLPLPRRPCQSSAEATAAAGSAIPPPFRRSRWSTAQPHRALGHLQPRFELQRAVASSQRAVHITPPQNAAAAKRTGPRGSKHQQVEGVLLIVEGLAQLPPRQAATA